MTGTHAVDVSGPRWSVQLRQATRATLGQRRAGLQGISDGFAGALADPYCQVLEGAGPG